MLIFRTQKKRRGSHFAILAVFFFRLLPDFFDFALARTIH